MTGDLIFVAVIAAFFALAAGFVRLCDRIIGPDDERATEAFGSGTDGVTDSGAVSAPPVSPSGAVVVPTTSGGNGPGTP